MESTGTQADHELVSTFLTNYSSGMSAWAPCFIWFAPMFTLCRPDLPGSLSLWGGSVLSQMFPGCYHQNWYTHTLLQYLLRDTWFSRHWRLSFGNSHFTANLLSTRQWICGLDAKLAHKSAIIRTLKSSISLCASKNNSDINCGTYKAFLFLKSHFHNWGRMFPWRRVVVCT